MPAAVIYSRGDGGDPIRVGQLTSSGNSLMTDAPDPLLLDMVQGRYKVPNPYSNRPINPQTDGDLFIEVILDALHGYALFALPPGVEPTPGPEE